MRGRLLLRADAGKSQGAGHVIRCLAIAEAWRDRGGEAQFVSRTGETFAGGAIDESGFPRVEPPSAGGDAVFLAQVAHEWRADWVVIDGYDFGLAYEMELRKHWSGGRVAVVDDQLRASVANVYVLPSAPLPPGKTIDAPAPAKLLGGLEFALLRKDFRRADQPPASSVAKRVLVVLGGTDAAGLVAEVTSALRASERLCGWTIRVIGTPPRETPVSGITFVAPSKSIAGELRAADMVVCTASTVALEACACGKPQVLLVVAENQKAVAHALCEAGAAVRAESPSSIPALLDDISQPESYLRMAQRAGGLIDGRGALRMVEAMEAFDLVFRQVRDEDALLLLNWSNDPEVRANSFSRDVIEWPDHVNWLRKRLSDSATWMRIAEDSTGAPFGILRLQKEAAGEYMLSISVAASHRGRGLGAKILRQGCGNFFVEHAGTSIRAEIRLSNIASRKIFLSAGFSSVGLRDDRELFLLKDV